MICTQISKVAGDCADRPLDASASWRRPIFVHQLEEVWCVRDEVVSGTLRIGARRRQLRNADCRRRGKGILRYGNGRMRRQQCREPAPDCPASDHKAGMEGAEPTASL